LNLRDLSAAMNMSIVRLQMARDAMDKDGLTIWQAGKTNGLLPVFQQKALF
jgi:hypothetical protein